MLILIIFAILAGAGTALSPCVLPVLPALLASGGVGGRRRPLGIVLGLSITFTVAIVGISQVVDGVGLGSDPLRDVAIVVLLVFGLTLLLPDLAARVEAPLSRLARLGPRSRGDGFRSGLLVGGALGFVYTPCASPILAAVISVSAATGKTITIALAYAFGSAVVLLALTLGGRRLFDRVRAAGRGPMLQRALGTIMILTALAISTNLDVNFDQFVAQHIPDVNLTASLECSSTVTGRLHQISGHQPKFAPANGSSTCGGSAHAVHAAPANASQASLLADAHGLKALGPAPEFTETEDWFNTGAGSGHSSQPLTLTGLRGRVVLVDFWTYTCINCIRTLPYLKAWDATYRKDGLTIVGVETPEFAFEHDASNVANAIKQFGLRYPVVQDNNMGTWNAYGNQYWPADYLIDSTGQVRYASFGEGDYAQTETAIRALLAEAGHDIGGHSHPTGVIVPSQEATPETYLGTARAQGFLSGPVAGLHDYGAGRWADIQSPWPSTTSPSAAPGAPPPSPSPRSPMPGSTSSSRPRTSTSSLSSAGERPRPVQVLLDGRPISAADAGADVHNGVVTVRGQRLYTLASLPRNERHRLSLRFAPGVTGYAFTFG